jgi:hydroxymethylbilane synthase
LNSHSSYLKKKEFFFFRSFDFEKSKMISKTNRSKIYQVHHALPIYIPIGYRFDILFCRKHKTLLAEMASKRTIRIASRRSELALVQSHSIGKLLVEKSGGELDYEVVEIQTRGDKVLDTALSKIGGKGLFTKELEVQLLDGRCDIAVHSLKDMPTQLPDGLILAAIGTRHAVADVVVFRAIDEQTSSSHSTINEQTSPSLSSPSATSPSLSSSSLRSLASLESGSLIGSSSLRRVAQLARLHPHLRFASIRGNLQTRLRKLDDFDAHGFEAIVLAEAGLRRMSLADRIGQVLPCDVVLPAVGQGALGIECRADADDVRELLMRYVNDEHSSACCRGERAYLAALQGGCQVPVGVHSELMLDSGELRMTGIVASEDGSRYHRAQARGAIDRCEQLGIELASLLKDQGAQEILDNLSREAQ